MLAYAAHMKLAIEVAEQKLLSDLIDVAFDDLSDRFDDYDGPERGDAWGGGFADNH